jgi:hypothetical protein
MIMIIRKKRMRRINKRNRGKLIRREKKRKWKWRSNRYIRV